MIPSNTLYQFEEESIINKSHKILEEYTIANKRSEYLSLIDDILNKIPAPNKQEKQNKANCNYYYKAMLKDEKNKLEKKYKKIVNEVRKAKKILMIGKTISPAHLNFIERIVGNENFNN